MTGIAGKNAANNRHALRQADEAWFEKAIARQARLRATDNIAAYLLSIGQSPNEWHVDLALSRCTNFRHDIGVDVGLKHGRWHAEIIDHPRFGPRLSPALSRLLCHTAARIYAMRHTAAQALEATKRAAARSAHLQSTRRKSPMEVNP